MQKPLKFGPKLVKHTFTQQEQVAAGRSLSEALSSKRSLKAELEQMKSDFKSREKTIDAKVTELETAVQNGFRMVHRDCVVVFDAEKRLKHFYLETDSKLENCVATEPMNNEDYVTDLLHAESVFDERSELQIFNPQGDDFGFIIVGKFGKQWYSAIRARIGSKKLDERLDSEQSSYKKRFDAVAKAAARFQKWAKDSFDKDTAAGFEQDVQSLLESNKEK